MDEQPSGNGKSYDAAVGGHCSYPHVVVGGPCSYPPTSCLYKHYWKKFDQHRLLSPFSTGSPTGTTRPRLGSSSPCVPPGAQGYLWYRLKRPTSTKGVATLTQAGDPSFHFFPKFYFISNFY